MPISTNENAIKQALSNQRSYALDQLAQAVGEIEGFRGEVESLYKVLRDLIVAGVINADAVAGVLSDAPNFREWNDRQAQAKK